VRLIHCSDSSFTLLKINDLSISSNTTRNGSKMKTMRVMMTGTSSSTDGRTKRSRRRLNDSGSPRSACKMILMVDPSSRTILGPLIQSQSRVMNRANAATPCPPPLLSSLIVGWTILIQYADLKMYLHSRLTDNGGICKTYIQT